jgi:superfamily II DNA/RNA helicase
MGALRLEGVRQLVLDEVDQLLAEGFRSQVEYFLAVLPSRRQMLAVSATFTKDLLEYLETIMHKPSMVSVVKDSVALKGVRQFFLDVLPAEDNAQGAPAEGQGQRKVSTVLAGRDKLKSRMQGLGMRCG